LRLVVAWMLGVVATLCVVALAARRGQLWFHETHLVCANDMMPAAMPAPVPVDAAPAAIREYLRAHFAEVDHRDGRTAWAYTGAPLVEVRNDRLQRVLPRTRFFKSTLATGDPEDPRLDVLVSYRHLYDSDQFRVARDDIRWLLFVKFGLQTSNLIGQFAELAAPTPHDQQEIALGIAELLATITYEGSARPLPNHGRNARAQLRYDGRPYVDIEILPRRGRVEWIAVDPRYTRDPFFVAGHSAAGAP